MKFLRVRNIKTEKHIIFNVSKIMSAEEVERHCFITLDNNDKFFVDLTISALEEYLEELDNNVLAVTYENC